MIPQVIHHAQLGGPPLAGLSFSHRHKFLTSPRPPGRGLLFAALGEVHPQSHQNSQQPVLAFPLLEKMKPTLEWLRFLGRLPAPTSQC